MGEGTSINECLTPSESRSRRQNRPVSELIFGKAAVDALDVDLVTDHVTRFTLAALGFGEPLGNQNKNSHKEAQKAQK